MKTWHINLRNMALVGLQHEHEYNCKTNWEHGGVFAGMPCRWAIRRLRQEATRIKTITTICPVKFLQMWARPRCRHYPHLCHHSPPSLPCKPRTSSTWTRTYWHTILITITSTTPWWRPGMSSICVSIISVWGCSRFVSNTTVRYRAVYAWLQQPASGKRPPVAAPERNLVPRPHQQGGGRKAASERRRFSRQGIDEHCRTVRTFRHAGQQQETFAVDRSRGNCKFLVELNSNLSVIVCRCCFRCAPKTKGSTVLVILFSITTRTLYP